MSHHHWHGGERFAAGLATRLAHHSGPRRLAIPYLAEDLHLLFFRQRDWRTPLWVNRYRSLREENWSDVRNARAPWKGGAFQRVQVPPGNRSSRKQPEQLWRQRNG
jgi:hypothetical protein